MSALRPIALSLAALLVVSCGSDAPAGTEASVAPAATADISQLPEDACSLVPATEVVAVVGVALDEGVPAGSEQRRVCTFQGDAIGVTVGIEAGSRFDEKADVSRRSLGVDGVDVDGLGDRALFFYSDADITEGVGGVLVAVGDLTIDVTLQGQDEAAMHEASVGIASSALRNL